MIKLSTNQILLLHKDLISEFGGLDGVKDLGMLESAINTPFQTFNYQDMYPTIQQKAARLCYGLVKNHPFIDGNKRIGVHAMLVFLALNRIRILTGRIIYYYSKHRFKSSNSWRFIFLDNRSSIIVKNKKQLWKISLQSCLFLFHCIDKSSCDFFWTSYCSANYYAKCPCVISCFCMFRVVYTTFCDYWHRNSFRKFFDKT